MSQNNPSFEMPTVATNGGTSLNNSVVRYEIVRMLLAGHSSAQISKDLFQYFEVKASSHLIDRFRKNYYHLYSDFVTKWEGSKVSNLAICTDINDLATEAVTILKEVDELQELIAITDERIAFIRDDETRSAQYERVLVDLLRTKMLLLERQTRIVGSSGMEERLRGIVKQTAIVMQETLLPFISEKDRERAYELFLRGISDILEKVGTL